MESTDFSQADFSPIGCPFGADGADAEPYYLAGLDFFKGDASEKCVISHSEAVADKGKALKRCAEVMRGAHAALDLEYAQVVDHLACTGRPSPCGVGCSACCKQAILSNPMPVSMLGLGKGVILPLASRLNCINTRFHISRNRSQSH